MKAQLPLAVVTIPEPCPRRWGELRGEGGARFCDACGKSVHNLSAMSAREAERFVAANPSACVAFEADRSGRVVSLEYAGPRHTSAWRRWWIWAAAVAGVGAAAAQFVFGTRSGVRSSVPVMGAMACPPSMVTATQPAEPSVLGKIEADAPRVEGGGSVE